MALLDEVLAMVGAIRRRAPVESDLWSVGLPFRAATARGAPTVAGLTHKLVAGLWENTIDKQHPTDRIDLRAPATGSLHLATRQGVEHVVIETAFDVARILRRFEPPGASPADATPAPFVARWTFRGSSLTGFAPAKAVEVRLAEMRRTQPATTPAQAAADLLATLRAHPDRSLEVFTGEVIGTLDAGPVTLVCELADGSALPLLYVYGILLAASRTLVTREAQESSLLEPVRKGPFGLFVDFFIPPDGDQHGRLPRGTATGMLRLQFEPGALVELGVLPGQRRVVAARPGGATHVTASLSVGGAQVKIQVPGNGAPSPVAAESWRLKLTARTQLTYVAGPPPSIVIEKPVAPLPRTTSTGALEYVYARLIPPQGDPGPITLEGRVSSDQSGTIVPGEVTIRFAVNGVSAGSAVTEKGRWKFTLPLALATGQRTLTLANGAEIATVRVLDVPLTSLGKAVPSSTRAEAQSSWLPAPTEPTIELTRNDAAGDTRDTFALAVKGDPTELIGAFGVGPYQVSWSTTLYTAAPWRDPKFSFDDKPDEWHEAWAVKNAGLPENKWPRTYGRWISLQLRTSPALAVPRAFSETWTPTVLELDDSSITARDRKALGLASRATWAGNKGKGAGPACGLALLGGEISRSFEPLAAVLPLEVRVVGYDFWEVRWQTFWDHLRAETLRQFIQAGYPHQDVLGLNEIDLAMLLLALFVKESFFNHFDYTAGLNQYALHPVQGGVRIDVPHGAEIWGRGPVTMPPPPREMRAQGMPTIAPPADCGVGQISPPTFQQLFDWRANVVEAVVRLRKPFLEDLRSWAISYEGKRLEMTVPENERAAARADLDPEDTKGRLTAFLNGTGVAGAADERGVLTDPRKLLAMLVKLYNGKDPLPYQSNLVWSGGQGGAPKLFAAGAGLAQQENPANAYARNTLDGFDKIKRNFTPPNRGVGMANLATIADFIKWCWLQR